MKTPGLLDYNATATLGTGAFGDVYKVETKTGDVFAMKHIIVGGINEQTTLQREVDAHKSLPRHENIVKFVDFFKSKFHWYIIIEFCELGTLESYVISHQPDEETCEFFMRDLARGLNHLHSNNIVHRDIKPENILLVQGSFGIPCCKISDFGVARMIHFGESCPTNGTAEQSYFSTLCGTRYFLAPEVLTRQYTNSCDIFSMGIVFYLLFSKTVSSDMRLTPWARNGVPFYKATDTEITDQLQVYIKNKNLFDIVSSMLGTEPKDRPTALQLVDKLKHLDTPDDEVFLAAVVLFFLVFLLVVLPFPLFVLTCMVVFVALWEFLPKSTKERINLLS